MPIVLNLVGTIKLEKPTMHALIASALAVLACFTSGLGTDPNGLGSQRGAIHPDREMEYKLRAARASTAHEEMVAAANDLARDSKELARRVGERGMVSSEDRTTLEQIRKLARKVRSGLGVGGDPKMDEPPPSPVAAVAALDERATALAAEIEKSTRFELNARLMSLANDAVFLSELILKLGGR